MTVLLERGLVHLDASGGCWKTPSLAEVVRLILLVVLRMEVLPLFFQITKRLSCAGEPPVEIFLHRIPGKGFM